MKPHIFVLGLVNNSKFGLGRQLVASCVIGEDSERIKKLKLDKSIYYDTLPLYDKKDIFELIDLLIYKKYLQLISVKSNKFIRVLSLTEKGLDELNNPSDNLELNKNFEGYYSKIEKVTKDDKKIFEQIGKPIEDLSDEQKKATISSSKNILCIAGAGSGKTRVLTKRAWFLSNFKNVEKILCITFTRKAKQEMIHRLNLMSKTHNIEVETFNSFCEKILRKYETEIYNKKYNVIDFKTKISLISKILMKLNIPIDSAVNMYYPKKKHYSKDRRTLFLGFINDIFSLLDYQRNNYIKDSELNNTLLSNYDYNLSNLILEIIAELKRLKKEIGLRDFTDQIVHVLDFLKSNKDKIPEYEHVLIDEYQDINNLQFELISLLPKSSLFAVGDPRQSIYGWRGSKIEFILDFEKLYDDTKILQLSTNYRSRKKIVDVCNKVIKSMNLPNLNIIDNKTGKVNLIKHDNEEAECLFVSQSILSLDVKRKNIFILARTNKQLDKISEYLERSNIKFMKRTIEESKTGIDSSEDEVTLSTIHAIKGLEADVVYIIGTNAKNLPCKASEHPLLEAVKLNDSYDKYEEERRLLYVAMSRARKHLVINYTGRITSFFSDDLIRELKKNS